MDYVIDKAMETEEKLGAEKKMDVAQANIKVIGAGGAGNNMVSWLYEKEVDGSEIIAVNTDYQQLNSTHADKKFLIGKEVTKGLGCGGYPEKGKESAKESSTEIKKSLEGSDLTFVCAGMGGGTGTGAAPVIAQEARKKGSIVIGVVTMPFKIERARIDKAEFGLKSLKKVCDTVIVIDNNRLVNIAGNLPVKQAFAVANELIATMIKGIVETISIPSLVNLDFADVKAIMSEGGVAAIGVGFSDTNNKVKEAVDGALTNPLLDISYSGATGAIIQVTGGPDMTLDEVNSTGELVTKEMDSDANVIWGARIDDDMKGKITIMTIITGVQSPWILGQEDDEMRKKENKAMSKELGIEMF